MFPQNYGDDLCLLFCLYPSSMPMLPVLGWLILTFANEMVEDIHGAEAAEQWIVQPHSAAAAVLY